MALKTKLIDSFYNVATGSRKIRNFFTPIGALFYTFLIFSFVVLALHVDRLIGLTAMLPYSLHIILSIPLFVLALFLIGWSVQNFVRAKGTPVPFNPPPRLVASGPYAYTRNPMLSGVFALLFGLGVFCESLSLLIIFTPLFIFINIWELKAIEEPELVKRLGDEYIEYRERTPMFLPSIETIFKKRE